MSKVHYVKANIKIETLKYSDTDSDKEIREKWDALLLMIESVFGDTDNFIQIGYRDGTTASQRGKFRNT